MSDIAPENFDESLAGIQRNVDALIVAFERLADSAEKLVEVFNRLDEFYPTDPWHETIERIDQTTTSTEELFNTTAEPIGQITSIEDDDNGLVYKASIKKSIRNHPASGLSDD